MSHQMQGRFLARQNMLRHKKSKQFCGPPTASVGRRSVRVTKGLASILF